MAFDWGNAFRGGTAGATIGSKFGPYGALAGGGLGLLSGFFGANNDNDIDKLFEQMPEELKKYLMPYVNAGSGSLNQLSPEYNKLLSDPTSIINMIGSNYQKSPGYDWQFNQAQNAINNAAASGGMSGTAQHQQQAGELATNLANKDYYNFLDKGLSLYGSGLSGHQSLANLGGSASSDLATSIANILASRAKLEYGRAANENSANSDMFSSILGFLK